VQYLRNLLEALLAHASNRVAPVLFVGEDVTADALGDLPKLPGIAVVRSTAFNGSARKGALLRALLTGRDPAAARAFDAEHIDVVFEAAQFFGSRLRQPACAWIPDFQHRYLPHLFPPLARLKREIGFRAQIRAGRIIVLSSESARHDCEQFHPATVGRTRVLRFAVSAPPSVAPEQARAVARGYELPERFFFMPNQFWQHKNHRLVVEALALLKQRGVTDIVVAASGKMLDPRAPAHFPNLKARIAASGLESQFRVLGMIPREHLGALLRSCVALLNPSLFEGWSTTVEEAKAQGTPMLLSDLDVHREQAAGAATFFDRHSAASLADAMVAFPAIDEPARAASEQAAFAAAPARQAEFAQRFADIATDMRH
jgi:glycosyltransferase involved in cell wall biosynthesis